MHIELETPIPVSPRVAQVRGIFDLPDEPVSRLVWDVELPLAERPWHLGLTRGVAKQTIDHWNAAEPGA